MREPNEGDQGEDARLVGAIKGRKKEK